MNEDDDDLDLEACWADVRGPKREPPPPPLQPQIPRAGPPPRKYEATPPPPGLLEPQRAERRRQLIALLTRPQETRVFVGLFTPEGEVTAVGYTRIPAMLRVENGTAHIDEIPFPTAESDWGEVLTAGVFNEQGEAIFYLDLQAPSTILAGDNLNLNGMTARLE